MTGARSVERKASNISMIQSLVHQDQRLRQRLVWLTLVCLVLSGLVLLHEYFVLRERPVSQVHSLVHFSLIVITVVLVAACLLVRRMYRDLRKYFNQIQESHERLADEVASQTRALRESTAFLETLFDSLQERVLIIDRDNRIVRANRQVLQEREGPIVGLALEEISVDCAEQGERRKEANLVSYTFREGRALRNRLLRGGRDCDRVFSIDTYPIFSDQGSVEYVIELARDVTHLKYREMQQQHQDKMAALGLLAAGVAHNLGNPLASISSELQMLKGETRLDRIQNSLDVLDRQVRRLADTIREITGFARKRTRVSQEVALHEVVQDTLRLLRHDPRARNVRFRVDLPPDLPRVNFNENDLILVLTNILVNSLEAMPRGGQISIEGEREGKGRVRLVITDTGVGMDEKILKQATLPLFTTRESEGTGLGLAIVENVMRSASGGLVIESRPGVGTRVILTFPSVGSGCLDEKGGERNGAESTYR